MTTSNRQPPKGYKLAVAKMNAGIFGRSPAPIPLDPKDGSSILEGHLYFIPQKYDYDHEILKWDGKKSRLVNECIFAPVKTKSGGK